MGFKMIYWTPMSGSYFLWGSILEKFGFFFKMAGLGKYHTGGYGRIGVYRVKHQFISCFCNFTSDGIAPRFWRSCSIKVLKLQ